MPFYEYECSACKFYVEALQKVSDEPLRKCPSCKKTTLQRLISAPVFRLKGGGWYETDFKQGNRRNIAEAGEGGEKKSGTAESKQDSATNTEKTEKKTGGEPSGSGAAKSSTSSGDA